MTIEHENLIYISNISELGGVETFAYEMIKKYQDNDIAVICKQINEKQKQRLKTMCPVYIHKNERIKCKTIIINYDNSILDYIDNIKDTLVCETIHADYTDNHYKVYPVIDKRVNKWLGITKHICKTFSEKFGVETELCYNPLEVEKIQKPLILVSATRLSAVKGKERMKYLSQALNRTGINYIWFVFTNNTEAIDNPNIIFMKPTLDNRKYILMSDYGIQLSDTEACSYTINEFLKYNKPVIVTPLPYLKEIGYEDGKTGYTVEFDCSNIDEVARKMVNKPAFINLVPKDSYNKYIVKGKSKYKEELEMKFKVRAKDTYQKYNVTDTEEKRVIPEGEEFIVTKERLDILTGNNGKHRVYVEVIEEIKEEMPEIKKEVPEVKEEVKKTSRKTTKKTK